MAIYLDAIGDYEQRDVYLQQILAPDKHGDLSNRIGNSLEDLRLSVRGYRLGRLVSEGKIKTNYEMAYWVWVNIAENQP